MTKVSPYRPIQFPCAQFQPKRSQHLEQSLRVWFVSTPSAK